MKNLTKLDQYIYKFNEIFNDELLDKKIEDAIDFLKLSYNTQSRIFIAGNGGSAANASHFAQDLIKATYSDYFGLKKYNTKTFNAYSLCDNTSFITAIANDFGYKHIFTSQLKAFDPDYNDLLFIISGSGNSKNILNVVDFANALEMRTLGLIGYDGGKVKEKLDYDIHIKSDNMYLVESAHSLILHYMIERLKRDDN